MSKTSHLIIEDKASGKIRVTAKGIELFSRQFAEVGVDIRAITTRDEVRHALDLILAKQMREFAQTDARSNLTLRELFKGLPGW